MARKLFLCMVFFCKQMESTLEGYKSGKKIPDDITKGLLELLRWVLKP